MTPESKSYLAAALEAAGQGHLMGTWSDLTDGERTNLLTALEGLDLEQVQRLRERLRAPNDHAAKSFEPPLTFPLERSAEQAAQAEHASALGKRLLRENRVGFVLVAGGQGSRLGVDGPKGMVGVGPVSGLSLFGWHAARLSAAQQRHGGNITWFVMTSSSNDGATRAFFEEQDFFGLGQQNVHFFTQEMLPALDQEGRIVRTASDALFLAPNGHGGTLAALRSEGMLDVAAGLGIEQFSYFQVDNPLVRPADPLFLGLHALADADMSSKVVTKNDPAEKVGVLGLADGKLGCIEYSDLPEDLRTEKDGGGQLRFRAGNIAVHMIRRDFVEKLTKDGLLDLPWHLAQKNLKGLDVQGNPGEVPGVKFETFVFDALGAAANSVTLEVRREGEFSPVKNAEGPDSPSTCRLALTESFGHMLQAAGLDLPERDQDGTLPLEVDPRVAEDESEFCAANESAGGLEVLKGEHGWLYR
ncbi:MAG TPA: UDPGP type 1 family protein [Planctomycetes bacterium]|nr:UDPGP type 1 family protein [Planctomycetota bacterium]HIL38552.1 UDPGP type 1 family protein [Planctomycetota bacterium]